MPWLGQEIFPDDINKISYGENNYPFAEKVSRFKICEPAIFFLKIRE
jgi:hypothetical protein